MSLRSPIIEASPLAWPGPGPGADPFLFVVHHKDAYPAAARGTMSVDPRHLRGRNIGSDFSGLNGFSLYHGEKLSGFPRHPHAGFETITLTRSSQGILGQGGVGGCIDHTDSAGAVARYGGGDLMWVTTGSGVQHSEMFPLLKEDAPNPLELFQIWINLPAKSKMAPPSFSMAWADDQPRNVFRGSGSDPNAATTVLVSAGELAGMRAPPPPPDSWAADAANHVVVATIRLDPGASWVLPRVDAPDAGDLSRMLYFFQGSALRVAGEREFRGNTSLLLDAGRDVQLENVGRDAIECLLLQGRRIREPVVQRGPFVATSQAQLREQMARYQAGGFGSWPFPDDEPANPREQPRFAKFPDGRVSYPRAPPGAKADAKDLKEDAAHAKASAAAVDGETKERDVL